MNTLILSFYTKPHSKRSRAHICVFWISSFVRYYIMAINMLHQQLSDPPSAVRLVLATNL